MSDFTDKLNADIAPDLAELDSKLNTAPEKIQYEVVSELAAAGFPGLVVLARYLRDRRGDAPTPVEGSIYQTLFAAENGEINDWLAAEFPGGVVAIPSDRGVDYAPLQDSLIRRDYQSADRLTLQKLCELAGPDAVKRKWLYFTEVDRAPVTDLQTLDRLWRIYSRGQFGFSVQREIWLGAGKNWEKLWPKLGWKTDKNWTRYPGGFTWDTSAPRGHLPLTNQLRGVRVMASLLSHPAWS